MKQFKSIIAAIMAMLTLSCTANANQSSTNNSNNQTNMDKQGKTLVVFFSHAGENYNVGNIKVGKLENVEQYDTVFIGGPVWWGTYPQVMFTFFRDYDLNGKTIIPFTTHEGSGLASCADDVRRAYPNADVKPGFAIYGHEVRSGRSKVEKWLKGLGF